MNELLWFKIHWAVLEFEFSYQKIVKIQPFLIFVDSVLSQIKIFCAKIQVMQVNLALKISQKFNWHNLRVNSNGTFFKRISNPVT